jgi:N-acetylglucosamine kinase
MGISFDIGGSRIRAARGGVTLGEVTTPGDAQAFVAAMGSFLTPRDRALAVSIAGVVDPKTQRIKVANIPCIDGRALGPELEQALGRRVLVLNDADCFALAEVAMGAARGCRNVFGIILGSGVGGGLVIDGRIVQGAGGFAGEWGHGPVIRDPAFACGCGQVGCLDTVGSARGLERLHQHLTGEVIGSVEVIRRWRGGREAKAVNLWLEMVSGQLAMVVNLVGAEVVPVGGGLSNDRALIAALDRAVRARILRKVDQPLVVVAEAGPDAGLIGAAFAGAQAFGGSDFGAS